MPKLVDSESPPEYIIESVPQQPLLGACSKSINKVENIDISKLSPEEQANLLHKAYQQESFSELLQSMRRVVDD